MQQWDRTCTTLDHVYPATVPGTPCHCGKRTWAGAPRSQAARRLASGTAVAIRATGERTHVAEVVSDSGDVVYRVAREKGRTLFDRDELEIV